MGKPLGSAGPEHKGYPCRLESERLRNILRSTR